MSILNNINNMYAEITDSLDQFGGFLRCETCGSIKELEVGAAGRYTRKGWPECCGRTMRWWTQKQIDNGEIDRLIDGGSE